MAEIEKLSLRERRVLMKQIALSIKAEEARSKGVPDEILKRAKEVENGEAVLLSWEEVRTQLGS